MGKPWEFKYLTTLLEKPRCENVGEIKGMNTGNANGTGQVGISGHGEDCFGGRGGEKKGAIMPLTL